MIDVYCVKVGEKYDRSFVEKLKDSVSKHLTVEHKFHCVTDTPEKDYDKLVPYPYLTGVFHKLSLFENVGKNLYFDLDLEINGNIDFLTYNEKDFKHLHVLDSTKWVNPGIASGERFVTRNNTFINSSVMRWQDAQSIFKKFMDKRDLYLRLYSGIDRFIYNERETLGLKYKTFTNNKISSWLEGVEKNTIMIYNGKYNDIRPEHN